MSKTIEYQNKIIEYEIIRKNVKNINIRVQPNGIIKISANENVTEKTIELLLIRRINWILKSINEYAKNEKMLSEPDIKFINGENFTLLGKNLRVKMILSEKFKVSYDNNFLYINVINKRGVKGKFFEWYNDFISKTYEEIAKDTYKIFKKYDVKMPIINILAMTTRWGTCNKNKNLILLNKHLIKAPKYLIEYVIMHEFTHLIFHNHSKDFYAFLTVIMPDWEERQNNLNQLFLKKQM